MKNKMKEREYYLRNYFGSTHQFQNTHKHEKETLGKFEVTCIMSTKSKSPDSENHDTYGFKKKYFYEMESLLSYYEPAIKIGDDCLRKNPDTDTFIYQVGDCAVSVSTHCLVNDAYLEIHNKDRDKRIETLVMLDKAFQPKKK